MKQPLVKICMFHYKIQDHKYKKIIVLLDMHIFTILSNVDTVATLVFDRFFNIEILLIESIWYNRRRNYSHFSVSKATRADKKYCDYARVNGILESDLFFHVKNKLYYGFTLLCCSYILSSAKKH